MVKYLGKSVVTVRTQTLDFEVSISSREESYIKRKYLVYYKLVGVCKLYTGSPVTDSTIISIKSNEI